MLIIDSDVHLDCHLSVNAGFPNLDRSVGFALPLHTKILLTYFSRAQEARQHQQESDICAFPGKSQWD